MMLKLNKHLFLSDPDKVGKLRNSEWMTYIPKRVVTAMDVDDDGSDADESEDLEETAAATADAVEIEIADEEPKVTFLPLSERMPATTFTAAAVKFAGSVKVPPLPLIFKVAFV